MEFVKNKDVSGCDISKIDLSVTLRITENCNRKCRYCHWNKGKQYDFIDIANILKIINEKFKNKKITIYLHGGEPTTHSKFQDILKEIKKYNFFLELQTNLDNEKVILKNLKYINALDISFHYPNSYSNFKKKIMFLKKYININCVDLVYVPEFENEIYKMKNFLNKIKIHNEITYNFFESVQYEEFIKKSKIYNLLTKDEKIKNDYFAKRIKIIKKCNTTKYCIINGDGNVFRCSQQLTNYSPSGNILKDSSVLEKVLINDYCPFEYCGYEYEYLSKA